MNGFVRYGKEAVAERQLTARRAGIFHAEVLLYIWRIDDLALVVFTRRGGKSQRLVVGPHAAGMVVAAATRVCCVVRPRGVVVRAAVECHDHVVHDGARLRADCQGEGGAEDGREELLLHVVGWLVWNRDASD